MRPPIQHDKGAISDIVVCNFRVYFQRGYRENLTEQEAKELVLEGIAAGIDNDLGSGSNIDLCVITAERGLEHHRGAWTDPGLDDDDIAAREVPEGRSNNEHGTENHVVDAQVYPEP